MCGDLQSLAGRAGRVVGREGGGERDCSREGLWFGIERTHFSPCPTPSSLLPQVQVLPSPRSLSRRQMDRQLWTQLLTCPSEGLAAMFIPGRSDHSCFCHPAAPWALRIRGTPWASSRSASWGGEQGCSIHRRGPHSSGPSQAQRTTPGGTGRNARLRRWWVSQPGNQRGEVSEGLTLLFSPQSLPASKLLPPNKAEGSLFASGGFCSVYALLRGSLVLKRHLG